MIALVFWILVWLIGGGKDFAVGDGMFWFLCACVALSFSQALATSRIGQTTVFVNNGRDEDAPE